MGNPNGGLRHGHKRGGVASPTYRIWIGMKRRCSDTASKDFKNYGAKGIQVCARWDASFQDFLADMGERPSLEHTIDRLDPSLGYGPENCRWATRSEQGAENKSNLRAVTVGDLHFASISAACRHFGVSGTTVNMRLKAGHSLETAVSVPTGALPNKRPRESYLRNPGTPPRKRTANGRFA